MFSSHIRRLIATGSVLVLIQLCFIFVLALGAALTPLTAKPSTSFSFAFYLDALASPALYTVKIASVSTLIAVTVGLSAAFFTANRNFPARKFLLVLAAVPLSVPPLLMALGFVLVFGMHGSLNQTVCAVCAAAGFPLKNSLPSFLYSFWGIVIVQGFYNFPLVMRLCTDVWQRLPPEEADSSRLLGASEWKVFRSVTLYQLAPTIASCAMLVFLYCFFSFVIVLLFGSAGGTTLEVAVYRSVRTSLDLRQGAIFALGETLIALCFVLLYSRFERAGRKSGGITGTKQTPSLRSLQNKKELFLFAAVFIPITVFFLWPLFSVAGSAFRYKNCFSFGAFKTLFSRTAFWLSLRNTIVISSATAVLSVTGSCAFVLLVRTFDPIKTKTWLRLIPLIPMAVSSVVLGFGIIILVKQGSPFILIAAQSALLWPLAFRYISSAADRIPVLILNAARLLSPAPLDSIFRIQLPLLSRSLISAFGVCFAAASAETSLPLILSIPRFETLAVFTYRLAGAYRFNEACAAGSILGLLTVVFFIFGERLNRLV